MKSISIIIPNFNGETLLKENIPSLFTSLSSSGVTDYEVIVPDDASIDGSIKFLENHYPEIIVIKNKVNKGFSGNVNTGIKIASKELVLILNSDVKLLDNYFSPLLKYFEVEDTFGVMGRIISMESDRIQDSAKYPYYTFGKIITTKNYLVDNRNTLYSLFMSGANSLVDRSKLIKLGGFNELFNPYYSEDADLGITAWRAGYKIYYEHNAICRHPNSATINKLNKNKVKTIAKRNKLILHYIHLDGFELAYFVSLYFLKGIFRLLILDLIYIKAIIMFCMSLKKISYYKRKTNYRNKTLKEICTFIRNDIKGLKITKF